MKKQKSNIFYVLIISLPFLLGGIFMIIKNIHQNFNSETPSLFITSNMEFERIIQQKEEGSYIIIDTRDSFEYPNPNIEIVHISDEYNIDGKDYLFLIVEDSESDIASFEYLTQSFKKTYITYNE